ncbi:MAG: long-chain fatty acid--CoA ligase, partial [Armatimonadetes bacterium]|nr:long-chain fatty acid--CoA ligase [Armatimonadota bacterium]
MTALGERPWFRFYEPGVPRTLTYPTTPLCNFLETSARKHPHHPAMILAAPTFHASISYRQFHHLASRFAQALATLGVKPGDRVAVMLPNLPQYLIAVYGILMAGAVVVQVNPLYRGRDLSFILKDSEAGILITLTRLYPQVETIRAQTDLEMVIVTTLQEFFPTTWRLLYTWLKEKKEGDYLPRTTPVLWFGDLLAKASPQPHPVPVRREDTAVLQYTGGTTGIPKAAVLTHRNLVANIWQVRHWLTMLEEARDPFLVALPLFHVYGLLAGNVAVATANTVILVLMRLFDARAVAEAIRGFRPSFFPGVPAMYLAINQLKDVRRYNLSSIKACVSGAAALPAEVQAQFERLTGGRLVEGFGLSEASPVTHANPIGGIRKPGSIGVPLPDTDAAIIDLETGSRVLDPGEIGELVVRGPQVMKAYWNAPEETRVTLRHGWLHTGDIARMDEDGYFFIVDRKKDMILAGGFNIDPREIEEVLYQHPKVKEAVALGVPDPYRGETPK